MPQAQTVTIRSGQLSAVLQLVNPQIPFSSSDGAFEPADEQSLSDRCRSALQSPLGFPELSRCVIPGDQIAIVLDPETPNPEELIQCVHEQLQQLTDGGVTVTLVLPPDPDDANWTWLRERLPLHLQQQLPIVIHNPEDRTQVSYVASSAGGERIYLNRHVAEADTIVTIGTVRFDRYLGIRGTTSCLFPALSDLVTQRAVAGVRASSARGNQTATRTQFRELVDEIGWLLGTQFTVQVVPGPEQIMAVLAGMPDLVIEAGEQLILEKWQAETEADVSGILISVPGQPGNWRLLGHAMETATGLVEQGGRIVVVADLAEPVGPAATMLRRTQNPEDLLRPLQKEPLQDSEPIVQLIQALQKARVYLRSQLPSELVEELGMIPLANDDELQRLLQSMPECLVIPNACYASLKIR